VRGEEQGREDLGVDVVELSSQDQHPRQDALDRPSEVGAPVDIFAEGEDELAR
jgi:hypothetical protein